jgi:hypothetical protein
MSKEKNPAILALQAASELLVAARRLREFSDPAITQAFDFLKACNPELVQFALHELGNIDKGGR